MVHRPWMLVPGGAPRTTARVGTAVLAAVAFVACSTEDAPLEIDAKADHAPDAARYDGPPAPVSCGELDCETIPADVAALGVTRCCLASGACGLETPFTSGCLAPDGAGGLDPGCPGLVIPSGIVVDGCCTPAGRCGVRGDFAGIGCVELTRLAGPILAQVPDVDGTCDYDPANDCTAVVEVTCDGPEDCPENELCCARILGGRTTRLGCFGSCTAAGGVSDGLWFEVCHPDQPCSDPQYRCLGSEQLPSFLYRCYVDGDDPGPVGSTRAGEVNCGDAPCTGGDSCCARAPAEPFCSAAGACGCRPAPTDAGRDGPNDGSLETTTAGDASSDSSAEARTDGID